MLVFFLLFAVAYPIFVSPQFLLSKGDWSLFGERIKSIIDFGETSNSQRIEIWKASLESIKNRPLLGVGIGNFPVVLNQNIFLARAGSSAHNIYLHIASEMGILTLVTVIWLVVPVKVPKAAVLPVVFPISNWPLVQEPTPVPPSATAISVPPTL